MPTPIPLLAYPFRPFFLLVGAYGALVVLAWVAHLLAGLPLPLGWTAVYWHSHEMLFGLVSAAIAGFLLTAMCNWTGAAPLQGHALLALILLWLAGRLVMWTGAWLPAGFVALIDLLFLPVLGLYVLQVLLRHRNRRNLILAAILLLLTLANGMMHLGMWQQDPAWIRQGENLAFNLITLLMVVIAGRITPAFSGNWLRAQGQAVHIRSVPVLERAVLIVTALLVVADGFTVAPAVAGIVALLAAALNGLRLLLWQGWRTIREPLLWILHLAYLWIVVALLLKGLAGFGLIAPSLWQHTLGVGGIGTLILGVMTRVGLGHTGRPLRLPPLAVWLYGLLLVAVCSRLLAALQWIDFRLGIQLAALAWMLTYGGFSLLYWPILSRPRADGRPG